MKISIGKKLYTLPFEEKKPDFVERINNLAFILNKKVNDTILDFKGFQGISDDALLIITVFNLLDDLEKYEVELTKLRSSIKSIQEKYQTEMLTLNKQNQTDLFHEEDEIIKTLENLRQKVKLRISNMISEDL